MKILSRCLLAWVVMLAVAHARPVFVENVSTISNPNPALFEDFPMSVAVDGDYAVVGAEYWDRSNPQLSRMHQTAFLYQRSGTGWALVRQLEETVVDCCIPRNMLRVAMNNGVAAVNTTPMKVYELGSSGWKLVPSDIPIDTNNGLDLSIDNGRIISNEGACAWDARIVEKSSDGVWRKSATLPGASHVCEANYAGAVDISGNRAIVIQQSSPEIPLHEHQTWIFQRGAQGWTREGIASLQLWPGEQRAFSGVTYAAVSGPDVLMGSGILNGINVYRDVPGQGFKIVDHIRPVDSVMGGGDSDQLKTSGDYLVQKTLLADRYSMVLNVYRRGADARYEHVAVLVHRGTSEWGPPGFTQTGTIVAISGRTVLATDLYNRVVYHFELPSTLAAPEPLQETFNVGLASNWTVSAGSQFAVLRGDRSRVLRQSQTAIDTRAIFEPANWTNQAIEVDVKANQFATDTAAISLITRWQGPHNFYEFVWGPTRYEFRRMASGTLRTLWSSPITPDGMRPTVLNHRLRLESIGTRHQLYIDGRSRFALYSTGPTRGRTGIGTYRASADFDNVQVTPTPLYSIYRNDFLTAEQMPLATRVGEWGFEVGYDSDVRWTHYSMTGEGRVSVGAPTSEQRVEARARVIQFAPPSGTQRRWFGVVARYVDESNHYTLALRNSNSLVLSKRVNGQGTTLGSFTVNVVPEQYYLIRLDAIGNQLRAYLDDRLLFEATDDAHASGSTGMAAFKAHAEFKHFVAYQP